MTTVAFIGTFDPLHGAHIGQLLRAHRHKPFSNAYILVNKHPAHKPQATAWRDRVTMAEMTIGSIELPFDCQVLAVDSPLATEVTAKIDYKITGIDSLIENLSDPQRWSFACRWPMLVLSIPGIPGTALDVVVATLPDEMQRAVKFDYVDETSVPMLNYDFTTKLFMSKRMHSSYLRAGHEQSMIPYEVSEFIQKNQLYNK
jgi:nicotinic acid mononucleotide adenylyltransferase